MKRLTITLFLIFVLSGSGDCAEEIHLHFPHFSGYAYEWKIFQGNQELTAQSGTSPQDGHVTLTMPEAYQDYQGMTRWLLKKNGGLDMIYTGNDFSVECLSEQPGKEAGQSPVAG